MNFKIWIALAGIVCATPAAPGVISGNQLYQVCYTPANDVDRGYCVGYVSGVWEGMVAGAVTAQRSGLYSYTDPQSAYASATQALGVCPPDNVTLQQKLDIATQYLKENPETRHEAARFNILQAYRAAFPCNY